MGKTSIEWTDASWNPIVGCTEISPGCANCYAARLAATRLKNTPQYKGLAHCDHELKGTPLHTRWTQQVRFLPERLEEPLHWRKPQRIFVCDMGDLFHEDVKDEWIESIFRAMWEASHHTFQILTKRASRMQQMMKAGLPGVGANHLWPGVSVENPAFLHRLDDLLRTPAALHFASLEPLLSNLGDITPWLPPKCRLLPRTYGNGLGWVIVGGESGANARPMHPEWVRSLRDQCQAAGVPFFFKQWGEWLPCGQNHAPGAVYPQKPQPFAAFNLLAGHPGCELVRVGKKKAGRLLDGVEHNAFPEVAR